MNFEEAFAEARKLVNDESFDGWIENDGPNCDEDGACEMLKKSIVFDILTHLELCLRELPSFAKEETRREANE